RVIGRYGTYPAAAIEILVVILGGMHIDRGTGQRLPYRLIESDRCVEPHLAVGIHFKYTCIERITGERCRLFREKVIKCSAGRKVAYNLKIGVAAGFLLGAAIGHQVGIDHFLCDTETS